MVELILLLIILLSGSAYGVATKRYGFSWGIAFSAMGATIILYLFGLFGFLLAGVYIVIITALVLWFLSAYRVYRSHMFSEYIKDFFCLNFFIYTLLFILVYRCNVNRLVTDWDAFSCWASRVKSMAFLDDFTTNPQSRVGFKSYPPAMACFQYLFQKLHMIGKQTDEFSEWRLFFAYQLFGISATMPLIDHMKDHKKVMQIFLGVMFVLFLPLLFSKDYYNITYIDPIVALMCGVGFAVILTKHRDSVEYFAYIAMTCFLLVLMKDVGTLLAVFISLVYFADVLMDRKLQEGKKGSRTIIALIPIAAVLIAKLSWIIKLNVSDIEIAFKGGNIDLVSYTRYVISGNAPGYYQQVISGIRNAFFSDKQLAKHTHEQFFDLDLSYFKEYLINIFLMVMALMIGYRKQKDTVTVCDNDQKRRYIVFGVVVILVLFYSYALGATYCSNFSEYEAVNLASYDRYMGIVFFPLRTVTIVGFMHVIETSFKEREVGYLFLLLALLDRGDYTGLRDFFTKDTVFESRKSREETMTICNMIKSNCNDQDKIYMVVQGGTGYKQMVCNYELDPMVLTGGSIGIPLYEEDVFTIQMDAGEWWNMLDEGYDYVVLCDLNDYFYEEYSVLFQKPEDIRENALYIVDHNLGKLVYVDAVAAVEGRRYATKVLCRSITG